MADRRNRRTGYYSYPRDEFDDPPEGPVGVHRGRRPLGVRALPYLVVLVLAALIGVVVWFVVSGQGLPWQSSSQQTQTGSAADSQQTTTQPGTTSSASPSQTETSSPGTASSSPTESASTTAGINKATAIRVVNGTGRQGYAAQKQTVLQGASYTNVTAANPTGTLPQASVVWYSAAADRATAQDVAARLGISAVAQSASISTPIVVVLMQ